MFATLDLEKDMSILDVENNTTQAIDEKSSLDRENKRLGIKSRSRDGCIECKRKKKKCDETRPSCQRCLKSNIPCVWRDVKVSKKRFKNILPPTEKLSIQKPKSINFISNNPNSSLKKESKNSKLVKELEIKDALTFDSLEINHNNNHTDLIKFTDDYFIKPVDLVIHDNKLDEKDFTDDYLDEDVFNTAKNSFFLEALRENVGNGFTNLSLFDINLNKFPSQQILQGLDKEEILYLDYYRTCVSQTVSILPNESNFFLSLYLPLAEKHKSILYALIGWAGVFLDTSIDSNIPLQYIKKAIETSEYEMKSKTLSNVDKLSIISLHTILCAVLICAGDVRDWYKHFQMLHKFLLELSNGELKNIKKYLGDSKEIKWLISNFLYHDVLASVSHIKGTCFKMQEYCQILDMNISCDNTQGKVEKIIEFNTNEKDIEVIDNDIVCDPLQGCVRPMYVLIGEITNTFVKLKNMEKMLKENEHSLTYEEFIKLRNKSYTEMDNKYKSLEKQIENTRPHKRSLCYLKSDKDLEIHLTLFEVFRLSASIYLKTTIKKIPPVSPEIQHLLVDLIPCINIIIGSSVQASLCFPLLVTGISSISQSDRSFIKEKVSQMSSYFPVKNFKRILVIIEETWKINRNGLDCTQWFDISSKFGWDLCLA